MSAEQWGFIFKQENCIQCHGCEVACKTWRGIDLGVSWRRVINIWNGEYPHITCSSTSISCMHCSEPYCIDVCTTGAISKRDTDGIVLVDTKQCVGCRACYDACPYKVPQFGLDGTMQKCDMCLSGKPGIPNFTQNAPPCVNTCPTKALVLKKMPASEKKEMEKAMKVFFNQSDEYQHV